MGVGNFFSQFIAQKFKLHTKMLLSNCIADFLDHQSHPAITCSNLTIETLEQGVKYVQS